MAPVLNQISEEANFSTQTLSIYSLNTQSTNKPKKGLRKREVKNKNVENQLKDDLVEFGGLHP